MDDKDQRNHSDKQSDHVHLLKNSTESFDLADFSPAQGLVDPRYTSPQLTRHRSAYQRTPSVASRPSFSRNPSYDESISNRRPSSGLGISDSEVRLSFNHERHSPPFLYTVAGEEEDATRSANALESGVSSFSRSNSQNASPIVDGGSDPARPSFQSGTFHALTPHIGV